MRNRAFRTRRIHRVRELLLLALFVVSGSLVGLYAWHRSQERELAPKAEPAQAEPARNLVLKGEGFDYQVTRDQRPLFRIRGKKMVSDRNQNIVLRGVRLTFFRDGGKPLELTSQEGTYQVGSQEAMLEGDVSVEAQDGVTLHAAKAVLGAKGTRLRTVGAVTFGIAPDLEGRADHLRADLKRRIYDLDGNIAVRSRPGAEHVVEITARRVKVDRTLGLVRATGSVRFRRDALSFQAPVVSMFFSGKRHHLDFIRGRWGVHLELHQAAIDGDDQTVEGNGWNFSLTLDAQGAPQRLALEAPPGDAGRVTLTESDLSGQSRRLTSSYVDASFIAGKLRAVHSDAPSSLRESFTFDPAMVVRLICSDTMDASFTDDGALLKVDLRRGVDFHQGQMQGRGDRGTFDARGDRLMLLGSPAQVLSSRGKLTAPQVLSTASLLSAKGGVEMSSKSTGAALVPGGSTVDSAGPAHLVAQSARWSSSPPLYSFKGKVRAWRGDDLLIADQIKGNPKLRTLNASGNVKSVWRSAAQPVTEATNGNSAKTGTALPVQVTADSLSYDRDKRLLVYSGSPTARQGSRTLACGHLEARETKAGKIDRVVCTEGVTIVDPEGRRQVKGEQATYLPMTSEAIVTGNPVRLRDSQGTEITGRRLIYNLGTGAIEMKAEDSSHETTPSSTSSHGRGVPGER